MRLLIVTAAMLMLVPSLEAQEQPSKPFDADELEAIEALVLYPEQTRRDILEFAAYPALLIRMHQMHKESSEQFQAVIAELDREDQGHFYEVARYPELVAQLAREGRSTRIPAGKYPKSVEKGATRIAKKFQNEITLVRDLMHESDGAFQTMTQRYPESVQQNAHRLLEMPEVLDILYNQLDMTILVGEMYKQNPAGIWQKADSMHRAVARAQAEELTVWQSTVQEDEQAQEELRQAGADYADEHGQTEEYDRYERVERVRVIYHYPYWFGYPYWHPYPYWRPVPFYYHTGFYIDADGFTVFLGLPSFYFVHWYYHYHPHRYVHLNNAFVHYHHRFPRSHSGFVAGLRQQVDKVDDRHRIDYFKPRQPTQDDVYNGRLDQPKPRVQPESQKPREYQRDPQVEPPRAEPPRREPVQRQLPDQKPKQPVQRAEPRQPVQRAEPYKPKAPREVRPVPPSSQTRKLSAPKQQSVKRATDTHQLQWKRSSKAPLQRQPVGGDIRQRKPLKPR